MLRRFIAIALFPSAFFLSYPAWSFVCPDQQTHPEAFSYYYLPPDQTHLSATVFIRINYDATHFLLGSMQCFNPENCHLAPPLLLRQTPQPVMLNFLPSCVYTFNTSRFHDPTTHPAYPGKLVVQLNYNFSNNTSETNNNS